MKYCKPSNQDLFAGLIFLLGLGYRLLDLGRIPLSDHEASLALPALLLAGGGEPSLLSQPGYISLTSVLFFLFGPGNFLARLAPALSGSLLIVVPVLFRKQLGAKAALILSLFLAIDPGILAFSRTGDGTMMALAFSLLAAGLILNGNRMIGGVCAGLALLGGPLLWPGLITGGVAAWLSRGTFISSDEASAAQEKTDAPSGGVKRYLSGKWGLFWLSMALTSAAIATQFFIHPRGLNGLANGFVDYLSSWKSSFPAPTAQSLLLFLVYEPVFLALAVFRSIKGWIRGDNLDKFLSRWMFLAVMLSLFNPGQTFPVSAWVLISMLALAARQAGDILDWKGSLTPQAGAQALLTFAMVIFMVTSLVNLSGGLSSADETRLKVIAVAGSFAILGLTTYLLGSGWGWGTTAYGLRLALLGLVGISVLSAGWHAAGLANHPDREMWRVGRTVISGDLLITTLEDISEYNTGRRDALDVTVAGLDSAALDWALKDFQNVSRIRDVASDVQSSILLTSTEKLPPLGDQYRGQKILWSSRPAWDIMIPEEWPVWLFFRKAPLDSSYIMIWVRTDLFPGSIPIEPPAN